MSYVELYARVLGVFLLSVILFVAVAAAAQLGLAAAVGTFIMAAPVVLITSAALADG